jgi:hypothetical protein
LNNVSWSLDEIDNAHALDWDDFRAKYPHRTFDAWRLKRGRTKPSGVTREFTSDKKIGEFDWRRANEVIAEMQSLKSAASFSQDYAAIRIETDKPIAVLALSDTHIGAWSTNHQLFQQITDEILETPNLYVALLGDLEQMAINAGQGIMALSDNLLPPELQHRYIESWLKEVEHRVLFSTWDNHAVMREEKGTGFSGYADIMKRKVIWHNGIGHPDVTVGSQTYRLAVSHRFRLRTHLNPVHGGMQYIRHEAPDRDISMAGDSHVAGITHWFLGATPKLSINCGSYQINSGYGKRFFSLSTATMMPIVVLHPDKHRFTGLPAVSDWMREGGA